MILIKSAKLILEDSNLVIESGKVPKFDFMLIKLNFTFELDCKLNTFSNYIESLLSNFVMAFLCYRYVHINKMLRLAISPI